MFVLKDCKVLPVTIELAQQVSSCARVPGERKVNTNRIRHLCLEIDSGLLTTFRWATATVGSDTTIYRVNGQHTALIFAKHKSPVGTVVLEHYQCDTIDDLVSLWSRFDPTISSRSKTDVMNTAFQSDTDLAGKPVTTVATAARAAAIIELGFGYTNKVSNYEKAKAGLKNKDFILWACEVFCASGPCLRVGVFLAALHTYRTDRSQAAQFWSEVQDGTNPNPNSGSRALQRLLLEHSSSTGNGARNGKKTLTWDQMAELSLAAWNFWLTDTYTKSLKLSRAGLAKFLNIPKGQFAKDRD